jgi:hypothetical protein
VKLILLALFSLTLVGIFPGTASAAYQDGNQLYVLCQAYKLRETNPDANLSGKQMYDAAWCAG